jgi:DNA polymerase-1
MIDVYNKMKEEGFASRMLLQVHDELVFDVLKSEKEKVAKIVKECMENAVKLEVPLDIEMEFAGNWLDAH